MGHSETTSICQRLEYIVNILTQICIGFVTIYMSWLCLRTGLAGTALHAWLGVFGVRGGRKFKFGGVLRKKNIFFNLQFGGILEKICLKIKILVAKKIFKNIYIYKKSTFASDLKKYFAKKIFLVFFF